MSNGTKRNLVISPKSRQRRFGSSSIVPSASALPPRQWPRGGKQDLGPLESHSAVPADGRPKITRGRIINKRSRPGLIWSGLLSTPRRRENRAGHGLLPPSIEKHNARLESLENARGDGERGGRGGAVGSFATPRGRGTGFNTSQAPFCGCHPRGGIVCGRRDASAKWGTKFAGLTFARTPQKTQRPNPFSIVLYV